jgi:putative transcriptional regulator
LLRWCVGELLEARGWTTYRFAKESGLALTTAYRVVKGGALGRVEVDTLERICRALDVQPGEVLEYVADSKRRARKA